MNGINSVTDSPPPGQAHRVVTPEAIAAVGAIVKENCRVTVNETATHLHMSHASAHHIVHDSPMTVSNGEDTDERQEDEEDANDGSTYSRNLHSSKEIEWKEYLVKDKLRAAVAGHPEG
jgi:hypothetical protein